MKTYEILHNSTASKYNIHYYVDGQLELIEFHSIDGVSGSIRSGYTKIPATLREHKLVKIKEIDARTEALISEGFSYQGKVFSLSENAQANILALYITRSHPSLAYPVKYSTKDDAGSFDAADASVIEEMYLTAMSTKRAHLDSGTSLKRQVQVATTVGEIGLVIDRR